MSLDLLFIHSLKYSIKICLEIEVIESGSLFKSTYETYIRECCFLYNHLLWFAQHVFRHHIFYSLQSKWTSITSLVLVTNTSTLSLHNSFFSKTPLTLYNFCYFLLGMRRQVINKNKTKFHLTECKNRTIYQKSITN